MRKNRARGMASLFHVLPNEWAFTYEKARRLNRLAASYGLPATATPNENGVLTAQQARACVQQWIQQQLPGVSGLDLGLPEVDDRYGVWRVALLAPGQKNVVGEVMVRCVDGKIVQASEPDIVLARLGYTNGPAREMCQGGDHTTDLSAKHLPVSEVLSGDAREVLKTFPSESIHLAITSPPYYNAKPQYGEFPDYEHYLALLEEVFRECHRILSEGRFLIVNASPVLLRRPSRTQSSIRIPVPFHINGMLEKVGFDFLEDIIWIKPEGAGWATGRGRRFAADRHPLQYKPVPVTEYFLVYRKHTNRLIDWNIRNHPDQEAVVASCIDDGYEVTNVWYEKPAHHKAHPAVFPLEIVEKLVRYYSFIGDVVLDPFAGVGTVGKACIRAGRRFVLIDIEPRYCAIMKRELDLGDQLL